MDSSSASTRERILLTAERLFAEHGLDQVSIRQINLAAGQRNSSATQYHFGNREALISAILDYRRAGINRRRLALLEALRDSGDVSEDDLRALAEALVLPVAELLGAGNGGEHYIAVVAQLIGHPHYFELGRSPGQHGEGLRRLLELVAARRADLPANVVPQRFGMALRQVFHELADFQRLRARRATVPVPLFVSGLVDAVAALLAAPLSAATRHELAAADRRSA